MSTIEKKPPVTPPGQIEEKPSLDDVCRVPRSIDEHPGHQPDWRFHQVLDYVRAARRHPKDDRRYLLPRSEEDAHIREYFKYRVRSHEDKQRDPDPTMRWAEGCGRPEHKACGAWINLAIRASVVAGMSDGEIADYVGVEQRKIELFVHLFWDVRPYLTVPAALASLIQPSDERRRELPRHLIEAEAAAFRLALAGELTLLDEFVTARVSLAEVLEWERTASTKV